RPQHWSGLRTLCFRRFLVEGDSLELDRRSRLRCRLRLCVALLAQERAPSDRLCADPGGGGWKSARSGPLRLRRGLPRLLRARPARAGVQPRGLGDLHGRGPALPRHAAKRGGQDSRPLSARVYLEMFPRLIHIGSFYLPTYGVMLAVAYLTAIWL